MSTDAPVFETGGDSKSRLAQPECATLESLPQDSLIRFMWAERRRFFPGLGYAISRVLVISPLPIFFKHIVDTQMSARDVKGILAISALTVVLLAIHQWLLVRGAVRLGHAVSDLVLQIRAVVFRKIQYLSFAYLDRAKTGRLLSKYAFDTQKVDGVTMPILNSFVPDSIYSIVTFAILLSMNWQLSAVVFLMLPLIALMRMKFFGRLRKVHEVDRLAQERLTGTATEMLGALRLLRSYGQEEQARDTLHVDTRNAADSRVSMINAASAFGGFSFASMRVLTLFVIAGGALLAIHGAITTGEMLAFVAGVPVIVQPIQLFVQLSDQYFLGQEAYRSIRELLDEPLVERWEGQHVLDPIRGDIEFDGVGFRYPGARRHALQDFSMKIRPGEKIALVGPSGAGKSTVASLLLGLYAPAEGVIRFDGVPQEDLHMRGLRRRIAIVLQESMLLSGSVADNLRFARADATDEEIREAARLANAEEFILRLPDGFGTVVGERGTTLSGGQRQRLSIARALLRNPAILILDEPTSALDYESERLIQAAMATLTEGRTVITIAHRLSTIRDVDRVVVLREGRKMEEGTFAELSERGEYFSALLKGRDIA